jgi:hypothetical protein
MNAEPEAKTSFQARWRVAWIVFMIWSLTSLLRSPFFRLHWPGIAQWAVLIFYIGSAVVCGFFIWAFRCTVCGGGIKLDGKTCSKCGRVFR